MSNTGKSRVLVKSVAETPLAAVGMCMEQFEWEKWVRPGSSVVIKPNVCSAVAEIAVGANTSPAVVRAVCEVLLTRTRHIHIGESRHLRQTPREAFKASGYVEMARELDVQLVNFSDG